MRQVTALIDHRELRLFREMRPDEQHDEQDGTDSTGEQSAEQNLPPRPVDERQWKRVSNCYISQLAREEQRIRPPRVPYVPEVGKPTFPQVHEVLIDDRVQRDEPICDRGVKMLEALPASTRMIWRQAEERIFVDIDVATVNVGKRVM